MIWPMPHTTGMLAIMLAPAMPTTCYPAGIARMSVEARKMVERSSCTTHHTRATDTAAARNTAEKIKEFYCEVVSSIEALTTAIKGAHGGARV
ncbi:hypothetical protein NC77_28620 [Janthinobacterium lividum]|nr:hypothetical protein NC77_28620 [Janthinobacterium lividum]